MNHLFLFWLQEICWFVIDNTIGKMDSHMSSSIP